MLTELKLIRAAAPLRAPEAWFLPGGEAADWLAELARWPVATERIALYLISECGGAADGAVAGALAVPPAGTEVPSGGRALPFGAAAPGVFLPVDAQLWPPVRPEELRALAKFPVLVFHPALGLTGCETAEARQAWELLAAPTLVTENWGAARSGTPSLPALPVILLQQVLTLDGLFGEESEDIGSDPVEELPPQPDEPSESWRSKVGRGLGRGFAHTLLGFTSKLPSTASGPTWANHLQDWARQKLAGLDRQLSQLQHRELHRLMKLLQSDPEQGLRHAISLANLGHRGQTAPGGSLGRRNLDFSFGRLGGGVASFWSIPDDIQSTLARQYREAAMRELKLGRHRRAACIFAELLGDFSAAADALKQGKHFREAALLYREKLKNPLAAAECLASGGLLLEAVALYEQQELWLEAADLQARLGDLDAERAAVLRAVEKLRHKGDIVGAARLTAERLKEFDQALELLRAEWPGGRQAVVALEEHFRLLAKAGQADEERALLRALAVEHTLPRLLAPLITVLVGRAEQAHDLATRHGAADAVRIKVALALTEKMFDAGDETMALRALARLAPSDRLLVRDVQRFRDTRKREPAAAPPPPSSAIARILKVEKGTAISLSQIGKWARIIAYEGGFCAVAQTNDKKIFFTRASWTHWKQSADWRDPAPDRGGLFLLQQVAPNPMILARPHAEPLEFKMLAAADGFGGRACQVGTPSWLPADAIQLAQSGQALWVVRVVSERVVLDCLHRATGALVSSRDVTPELVAAGATGSGTALTLAALEAGGEVALGYGRNLLVRRFDGTLQVRDLHERIVGLVPVRRPVAGWLVLLSRGATFVHASGESTLTVDQDLEMPQAAVLPNDQLVLLGGEAGLLVTIEKQAVVLHGRFTLPGGGGVGLVPAAAGTGFAVLSEAGTVQTWRVVA